MTQDLQEISCRSPGAVEGSLAMSLGSRCSFSWLISGTYCADGCKRFFVNRKNERGPSAPVPSIMYENLAGVDMMYHLDDRWRCQSLVYLGEPQDLAI